MPLPWHFSSGDPTCPLKADFPNSPASHALVRITVWSHNTSYGFLFANESTRLLQDCRSWDQTTAASTKLKSCSIQVPGFQHQMFCYTCCTALFAGADMAIVSSLFISNLVFHKKLFYIIFFLQRFNLQQHSMSLCSTQHK